MSDFDFDDDDTPVEDLKPKKPAKKPAKKVAVPALEVRDPATPRLGGLDWAGVNDLFATTPAADEHIVRAKLKEAAKAGGFGAEAHAQCCRLPRAEFRRWLKAQRPAR